MWWGANLDWFVCVLSAIKPLICPWEETGTECNDMSDFPLGWLLGSQGTVSSEAKQPFSRSVLSQRKVTINDFFTLQSVSGLLSPPSFCDNPWLDDEGPSADNPEIYNVTELQTLQSHELILMAALNPFIRTFYYSASQALSDFQWSCENIKRQSKLTLSSQIIISSLEDLVQTFWL